jgi:SAM-dependent methyltransferase
MDTQDKLKLTKEHWENPQVESLKDANLRSLEINSIITAIKTHANISSDTRLADFGCGDGFDTLSFSKYASKSVGFDYSREMLSRTSQRQSKNLSFQYLDLISGDVPGAYDVVVSKRFIINLGEWSIQSKCINKIAKTVLPGGLFCLLECYKQGLTNLNLHRNKVGLPPIVEPYHNTYLDYDQTLKLLSQAFSVIEVIDFSTYFYLTRCLSTYLIGDKTYDLNEKMRLFSESDDVLQGSRIGPQTLICLRKK